VLGKLLVDRWSILGSSAVNVNFIAYGKGSDCR
jgi:hypothetical protein